MTDSPSGNESPEDEEWQFGLDEVGPDGAVKAELEPGRPALENVLFVLVGVALTLWLLLSGI